MSNRDDSQLGRHGRLQISMCYGGMVVLNIVAFLIIRGIGEDLTARGRARRGEPWPA